MTTELGDLFHFEVVIAIGKKCQGLYAGCWQRPDPAGAEECVQLLDSAITPEDPLPETERNCCSHILVP